MSSAKDFVYYRKKRIKFTPEYYTEFSVFYEFFTGEKLPPYKDLSFTPDKIKELADRFSELKVDYSISFLSKLNGFQGISSICENPEENINKIIESESVSSVNFTSTSIAIIFDCEMFDPNSGKIFDFGTFNIEMHENEVYVFKYDNNTDVSNLYHPYVSSSGVLCLGDFKNAYKTFFKSLRFVEAFDIVENLLTKYGIEHKNDGSNSDPHANITNWLGHQCVDCLNVVPYEETILCYKTSQIVCNECAKTQKDEVSGKVYVSSLLSTCETCEKTRFDVQPFNDKKMCLNCRAAFVPKKKVVNKKEMPKRASKKAPRKKVNISVDF